MRLSALIAVTTILAIPTVNAADKSSSVKDWTFQDYGDGTSGAFTTNESGSTLGLYCAAQQKCMMFLRADTSCTPDAKYPLMVNSDSGSVAANTTCTNLGAAGKSQYALMFDDFNSMLGLLLNDHTIGFAIPMASGMFKVTRFSLEGSNEVLAAVGQSLKGNAKPAGLKDQVL